MRCIQALGALRAEHRGRVHRGLPGPDEQQHCATEQQREPPRGAVPAQAAAALPPDLEFTPHRRGDEPAQLDGHHQEAQRLEEEVVDEQRDAEEEHQAVEPGGEGKGDQEALPRRRKGLGRGVAPAEEPLAQPPAAERERALVQVGHVERVRQQEVAVEAHERARVDREREQPGGGGEQEGARPHRGPFRRFGQQRPGERGDGGERDLAQHAGRADGQALAARGELPGVVGVCVEHRPQHQEGHAHRGHVAAEALRGEGVAQLVQHLGDAQRHADGEQAAPGGEAREGVGEVVPAARGECQAQQRGGGDGHPEGRLVGEGHARGEALQPGHWPHQRQPEEEVVLDQPPPRARAGGREGALQAFAVVRAMGQQQVVVLQHLQQAAQVGVAHLQRGLALHRRQHLRHAAERPAREHLEGRPAQLVEAVGGGVVQCPGGRAVGRGGAGVQREVLPQRWQGVGVHHPSHCRSAASGRRSTT